MTTRWEWRTFGPGFGRAETAFATLTSTAVQESDEVYLLGPGPDVVKVRADLMDIKTLREVDEHGFERWEPVLKAAFPMSADDARRVDEALGIGGATLDRDAYTLDQFLGEVATPTGAVRAVPVHKRRVRYTIEGCSSEFTDVVADGRPTRTIAIESEDADAVASAVRSVGLEGYVNTNYPRGLAALLDGTPPRYAVIDVGTNSVKFHVGERDAEGRWHAVVDRAEVTRLGEGIEQTGEIGAEPLARTVEAILGMVEEARRNGALAIVAVGTAGLRAAANRDKVVAAILDRAGVRIEVISGEEEARLAFLATKSRLGLGDGKVIVFDTGGGSTQLTFAHGASVDERFSLPVGAVRFTEQFGLDKAVSAEVVHDARTAIAAEFGRLDDAPRPDSLIAMGGAVTNLSAVMQSLAAYDNDAVDGSVLDRSEIERQIELYRTRDADERRAIVGLQPARAEVILAGACVVLTVMEKVGHESLTVSDSGLRHGLLVERFG
jgi:exopolyphosphatase / guanosine-5'-triphosphate,3'-diphosphate pyrophosphatase